MFVKLRAHRVPNHQNLLNVYRSTIHRTLHNAAPMYGKLEITGHPVKNSL